MCVLDTKSCYQALLARDARFDGRLFVGVATTGIYCRPVCPARTPAPDRCTFYPSAAAAERAGFRACLRCRPELAPGNAPMDSEERLLHRALQLVRQGHEGILSQALGVSDRQLRQVFAERLGASPQQLVQSHRLALAKQLLTETSLTVTEVAYAAGFASLRRFQAVWKERMGMPPQQLRRLPSPSRGKSLESPELAVELAYRPPYDWKSWLAFIGTRAIPGMETVTAEGYRRTVTVGGTAGWIHVAPRSARLRVCFSPSLLPVLGELLGRLRQFLDLDADPEAIGALLGDLYAPGLRVPGAVDGFELAVRAVLGQQVSVKAAVTLAARLVERHGSVVVTPFAGLSRGFPSPAQLRGASLEGLGLTGRRCRTLEALIEAVVEGRLDLSPSADWETARTRLLEIPGIGPWSADYIAMRAWRCPDAFPEGDLVLCKSMQMTPRQLRDHAERWRPWRSYAALSIWKGVSPCMLPVTPALSES